MQCRQKMIKLQFGKMEIISLKETYNMSFKYSTSSHWWVSESCDGRGDNTFSGWGRSGWRLAVQTGPDLLRLWSWSRWNNNTKITSNIMSHPQTSFDNHLRRITEGHNCSESTIKLPIVDIFTKLEVKYRTWSNFYPILRLKRMYFYLWHNFNLISGLNSSWKV